MNGSVVALSGGVGGAKLVLGLAGVLDNGRLTVIANTGDDFHHLGLAISPDLDTLLYTLAGIADPVRGWGRRDETWNFLRNLEILGGETWFRLGDADLAMHVARTRRLAAGETLSVVTDRLRRQLGIATRVVPMSDDPVPTKLRTDDGWLDFQEYFVRRRCAPVVHEIAYQGAAAARSPAAALAALRDPQLRAVILCPSNPFLSIGPILAVPGIRAALARCTAPVLAVSPIVGGQAVKGPTAKMMRELGLKVRAAGVADCYAGLIDALVTDDAGAGPAAPAGVEWITAPTLMVGMEERTRLARVVLAAADRIAATPRRARRGAAG